MKDRLFAVVSLDVEGIEAFKAAVDEATDHLRAASKILEGIRTVKLEFHASEPRPVPHDE